MTETSKRCIHNIIYENGFEVCNLCGETFEPHIINTKPNQYNKNEARIKREFNQKTSPIYVGSNINKFDIDALGYNTILFKRLRKLSCQSDAAIALKKRIYGTLGRICNNLNITNISIYKTAIYFYEKITKNEQPTNHVVLIAMCLYMSIKYHNLRLTTTDISNMFILNTHRVRVRDILKYALDYRAYLLVEMFKPSVSEMWITKAIYNLFSNDAIIKRMRVKGNSMNLDEYKIRLELVCREILKKIPLIARRGRDPIGFAGGTIYVAELLLSQVYQYRKNIKQIEIAESLNISEITIRTHYQFIEKAIDLNKLLNNIKILLNKK